jgi:succinyl-diaminopimelate desuccinylase
MAVQGSGLMATVKSLIPPLHVPVEHPLVIKLMKVFAEKTGSTAPPIAIGGRTYACAIGTGVAYGPIFPGCPEVAHQHDEYIGLDELVLCARIYAAAMAALAEA